MVCNFSKSTLQVAALDRVYVQLQDRDLIQRFMEMTQALNDACPGLPLYTPSLGEFVAAMFTDNTWYRGLVEQKIDEQTFKVLFVDYGNTDAVKVENIRRLDEKFASCPMMTVRCQLKGSEGMEATDLLDDVKLLENTMFSLKAVSVNQGFYSVELYLEGEEGRCVNSILNLKGYETAVAAHAATDTTDTSTRAQVVTDTTAQQAQASIALLPSIPDGKMPLEGTLVRSAVVHIEGLDSFFIQVDNTETNDALMAVLKAVNQACEEDSVVYRPRSGECVSARFTDDGVTAWYRARVVDLGTRDGAPMVKVFILDYGNTDWVGAADIRALGADMRATPALAIHCKLLHATGTESPEMVQDFQSTKSKLMDVRVVEQLADRYLVDMFISDEAGNKHSISEFMFPDAQAVAPVTNGIPASSSQSQETIPKAVEEISASAAVASPVANTNLPAVTSPTNAALQIEEFQVTVGQAVGVAAFWIDSIHSFYVQLADERVQQEFNAMLTSLTAQCEGDSTPYCPTVGQLVAAHFKDSQTEMWCRARVLEVMAGELFRVFFLDYGNTDNVSANAIRNVDDKIFLSQKRMAIHCGLVGTGEQTEAMLARLKEHLYIELVMTVVSEEAGKYSAILETSEGQNINTLIGLTLDSSSQPSQPSPTEIVDSLPKQVTPNRDVLPKKVASPPRGERKTFFSQTLAKVRPQSKEVKVIISSVVRPNLFHCQEFVGAEREYTFFVSIVYNNRIHFYYQLVI